MSPSEINETKNNGELNDLTKLTNKEAQQLKLENAVEKTTNIQNEAQEGLDKEKKTYTNSKSGLIFNLYDQAKYGKKLAATWCMLTSAACVSSAIDKSLTPVSYYKKYPHGFVYDSIPKMTNNKLQSKVLLPGEKNKWTESQVKQAQIEIEKNLEKWYPAIFMVRGRGRGWKNKHVPWQHYMAAVDIRENWEKKEVFIANTDNNRWGGWVSADEIFVSMKQASIYTPA